MPLLQPATDAGRAGLAALLAEPRRALVGLDFDGTLAPIVPDPEQARAHPEVPRVLAALADAGVQVALITGRPAAVAVEYGRLGDVPGLVVLGHYGLERWADGTVTAPEESPAVAAARRRVHDLIRSMPAAQGVWVEDKGRSVAVHTRRAADPHGALGGLEAPLRSLAEDLGLVVEHGRLVLELRPPGTDKGEALLSLIGEDRPSAVVFIGDDLGDLAAFDAVAALRARGVPGLLVCSGSTEVTELAQRADLVVDGPDGVVRLLGELADRLARPAHFRLS